MALLDALIDHWGAVQRDLLTAGLRWDDLGTGRLSLGELAYFVNYAPPGTALYHMKHKGFTTITHLMAMAVDELRVQTWLNTADAQEDPANQQYRPRPIPRPGVVYVDPDEDTGGDKLTVESYLARIGMTMTLHGEETDGQEA